MTTQKIYKPISIWKRVGSDRAIIFRCFEIVGESKFCVQSVDYYDLPINDDHIKQMEKQSLELFIEVPPEERAEVYSTLEEAIVRYEKDF